MKNSQHFGQYEQQSLYIQQPILQSKQDKQGDSSQQQQNQKNQQNLSIKSTYFQFYKSYLQQKDIHLNSVHLNDALGLLKNTRINFDKDQYKYFNQELIFQNIQTKQNIKIVTLKMGRFRQKFKILIQNQHSPFHNDDCYKSGCFGKIYPVKLKNYTKNNQEFVIKCVKIDFKKPQSLRFYLKEYFILNIFSQLEIGPKSQKHLGFDMIIWKDCIEYSMQKCLQIKQVVNQPEKLDSCFRKLSHKLLMMHKMNIVHLDIKIDNIMFSQYLSEPVFIDFGCARIISETIGETSKTQFVGTFEYVCDEMKKAFFGQVGDVDLYYNDIYCLKNSQQKLSSQLKYASLKMSQQNGLGSQIYVVDKQKQNSLEVQLLLFKYFIQQITNRQIEQRLQKLIKNQRYMIRVIIYLASIKPTHFIRCSYQIVMRPYLYKYKQLYRNKTFRNTSTNAENQVTVFNIYELLDYLQIIFIKCCQPFKCFEELIGEKMANYLNEFQKKHGQKFQFNEAANKSTTSSNKQQTKQSQFMTFYKLLHKKKNIQQFKQILVSKQAMKSFPKQYYFSIFIYTLDFTKDLKIDLKQKNVYAKYFCEIYGKRQQIDKQNQQTMINYQNLSLRQLSIVDFQLIKESLNILLEYVTSQPLTQFKLVSFTSICIQYIIIYSTNVPFELPKLNHLLAKWLQLLADDKNYSPLSKFSEIFKLLQGQYIMQLTDLDIINYEIMDKQCLSTCLNKIKLNYQNLTPAELSACAYYEWLLKNYNVIHIQKNKIQHMQQKLQKDFQISAELKQYFIKYLEIKIHSAQLLIGQTRTIWRLQIFQQALESLKLELQKNKLYLNSEYKLFLLNNKLLKSAVSKFQYQKAKRILSQVQKKINCPQVTQRMFLLQKCYLMKQKSFQRLLNILDDFTNRNYIQIKKINLDFVHHVICVLKFKIYNLTLGLETSVTPQQSMFLQLKIVHLIQLKEMQFEEEFDKSSKILYFWLETLDMFYHICIYCKKQAFSLYARYYLKTQKFNHRYLSKIRFLFAQIVNKKINIRHNQQIKQIIREFQTIVLNGIQQFIQTQKNLCSTNQKDKILEEYKQLDQVTQRMIVSSFQYIQIEPIINIYFKTVIYILEISYRARDLDKVQEICEKILNFSVTYQHYISFFQGSDIIFDVLLAISNKIFRIQNQIVQSIDKENPDQSSQRLQLMKTQVASLKESLWTFIIKISIHLKRVPQKDVQIAFLKQLQKYFMVLRTFFLNKQVDSENLNLRQWIYKQNSKFLPKKNQIIELLQFYYQKLKVSKQVFLEKYNGLLMFAIHVCELKKQTVGLSFRMQKRFLHKITKSLNFVNPFLKHMVLGKYYSVFSQINKNKSQFSKLALIYVSSFDCKIDIGQLQKMFIKRLKLDERNSKKIFIQKYFSRKINKFFQNIFSKKF